MNWDWLRDSAWGGIAAIAAVLSLALSVVGEMRKRFSQPRVTPFPRSPAAVTNSAGLPLRPVQPNRQSWFATIAEDVQMTTTVGSFVGWLICAILLAQTFLGSGFFSLGQLIITFSLGLVAIVPPIIFFIWLFAAFSEKDNLPFLDLLGVGGLYLLGIAVALLWGGLLGVVVPPVRETIESNLQNFFQSWKGQT